MKILTILIGLTISINVLAQQLTYQGEPVDTLKIISNSSYYHFDTCGTTTGIYDEYIIVFNKEENNYFLKPHQRTKYKFTFKPASSSNSKKIIKEEKIINKQHISKILKEFEMSYVKPKFDNIGLTFKHFQKLTNKKHIIEVAKNHKSGWYFKKEYSTKKENKEIFTSCQNTDTLNLYLETNYDTSSYVFIMDVDYHFNVVISTAKNTYNFEGKYPNSYKQPWYKKRDDEQSNSSSILNFSINTALVNILPTNFSNVQSLKFESLTYDYIKWYLIRKGVLL